MSGWPVWQVRSVQSLWVCVQLGCTYAIDMPQDLLESGPPSHLPFLPQMALDVKDNLNFTTTFCTFHPNTT